LNHRKDNRKKQDTKEFLPLTLAYKIKWRLYSRGFEKMYNLSKRLVY
jgi:hypothetical protein